MSYLIDASLWCAAAVATIAALVVLLGYVAYISMIRYRMRDEAYQRQAGLEAGDFDASAFDLPWIEENVLSRGGYPLRVHALEPEGSAGAAAPGYVSHIAPKSRGIVVLHHGIGWGWIGMIRYMLLFRAEGWTAVAYDARGHGAAARDGGPAGRGPAKAPRPSYGYFEKEDLKTVVDWAVARFGPPSLGGHPAGGRLVVFGESMGAATVLQYAPLDGRVGAAVADCPFSSAMDELEYQLRRAKVIWPFRSLAASVADAFCRRNEGFSLRDADPARAILQTEVPILFIHGLEDRFVPWSMSVAMAERRRRVLPGAVTELLLVPGARHGGSARADRERYAEALREFLSAAGLGPEEAKP